MKKLISLVMVLVLVFAVVFAVPVNAAATTLTITTGSGNSRSFKVGEEFVYTVGIYAGEEKIMNCQAYVEYDPDYVEVVDYAETEGGDPDDYSYSNIPVDVTGNTGVAGIIKYNFTKGKGGVDVFNDADERFVRYHFKVKATGTTEITHTIAYMVNMSNVRVYYNKEADETIKPYDKETLMLAKVLMGDVDGDGKVNAKDARTLSRHIAKWAGYENAILEFDAADMNGNGSLAANDARSISRLVAGWEQYVAQYGGKYLYR